jgi:glycosyltransferase involved in cell wall biosynthesis
MLLTQQLISMLRTKHQLNLIVMNRHSTDSHWFNGLVLNSRPPRNKRASQALSVFSPESMVVHQTCFTGCKESLQSHLNALRPDVVIFNHIRSAWLLTEIDRSKTKMIYLAHNAEGATAHSVADMQRFGLTKLLLRHEARKVTVLEERIMRAADCVITLTPEDADRLSACAPSTQFAVIPPAVELREHSQQPQSNELLLLGSFRWLPKRLNAIWLAKEVMPLVRKCVPDATLRIVGTEANRLESALGACPGVVLHSNVPSVDEYYARAAVFVVPERQVGGIKLKTLEAASFGKAIVTTAAGREGTGLIHNKSCLVADSAQEFAAHILSFLRNPMLRQNAGDNARDYINANFSQKAIERQYNNLLHGFTTGSRRMSRPPTLVQKLLLAEK